MIVLVIGDWTLVFDAPSTHQSPSVRLRPPLTYDVSRRLALHSFGCSRRDLGRSVPFRRFCLDWGVSGGVLRIRYEFLPRQNKTIDGYRERLAPFRVLMRMYHGVLLHTVWV